MKKTYLYPIFDSATIIILLFAMIEFVCSNFFTVDSLGLEIVIIVLCIVMTGIMAVMIYERQEMKKLAIQGIIALVSFMFLFFSIGYVSVRYSITSFPMRELSNVDGILILCVIVGFLGSVLITRIVLLIGLIIANVRRIHHGI